MSATVSGFRIMLLVALTAACGESGERRPAARMPESVPLTFAPRERIQAFSGPNAESLFVMVGRPGNAMAGHRAAVLLPYDDRIAVYDVLGRSAMLLGGRGSGPGELSGGMWSLAQSPGGFTAAANLIDGRVHVWAPDGRLRFTRVVTPTLDPYPTVGVDDSGRAYVSKESYVDGRRRVQLLRLGRDRDDSAGSDWLPSHQALIRHDVRRTERRTVPSTDYVYGADRGKLWWAVNRTGLVFMANADRYRVDTLHLGGRASTFLERTDIQPRRIDAEERHRVLEQFMKPSLNGPPIPESEFGEMRRAVIRDLLVVDEEIWVGTAPASDTAQARSFDVYDVRNGRLLRVVNSPVALIGIGDGVALTSRRESDDERSLVVLQLGADGPSAQPAPAEPPIVAPRAVPVPAVSHAIGGGTLRVTELPELGCASGRPVGRGDTLFVSVRILAGPKGSRRRLWGRVVPQKGGTAVAATLSIDAARTNATCNGTTVEFTIKGTLRQELTLVASGRPVSLTLSDENTPRRVARRSMSQDGEPVLLELPPR